MSRFRMHTVVYRRWAPTQSPLGIEFGAELLREMRMEIGRPEGSGVLYGTRHANEVRVLAARRASDAGDPRLAGMELLGICALRVRGEVFLTESDLERFEKTGALVALIAVGMTGGFFVRDAGGAVQAIKSYEEFSLVDSVPVRHSAPALARGNRLAPKRTRTKPARSARQMKRWAAAALASFALVAIPLLARPLWPNPPIGLAVHEEARQLRITWNRAAIRGAATLAISDGGKITQIPLAAMQSNLTYVPAGGDVEVQLSISEGGAAPRGEVQRFVLAQAPGAAELSAAELERGRIAALESDARGLREVFERGRLRVAELQRQTALEPAGIVLK